MNSDCFTRPNINIICKLIVSMLIDGISSVDQQSIRLKGFSISILSWIAKRIIWIIDMARSEQNCIND
jgi:hypothetical protein